MRTFATAAGIFLFLSVCSALPFLPKVKTSDGEVEGLVFSGIHVFHSIPFAAPPVGDLRFRSPAPVTPWKGVKKAGLMPRGCPQMQVKEGIHFGDEDCLYLHVYAPKVKDGDEPLPVVFWLFGGAYIVGDGHEFGYYDGVNMAKKHNVIVVAPNYRLGPLGFLAHPHLQKEDPHGSTGNMGVQDQRMALQWVQKNIHLFGGDPTRVTMWGQSAGAMSICHHMSNTAYPGLFSAAIMDSGTCDGPEMFPELDDSLKFGEFYSKVLGCDSADSEEWLTCMRALKPKMVIDTMASWFEDYWPAHSNKTVLPPRPPHYPIFAPEMPWGPVIDGTTQGLPRMPLETLKSGDFLKVPLMLGSNHDEGSMFMPIMTTIVPNVSMPAKEGDVERIVHHLFGAETDVSPILNQYASANYESEKKRGEALFRDYIFACAARRVARNHVAMGQDVFVYQYNYKNEWIDYQVLGTWHSSELQFVFENPWPAVMHEFYTKEDKYMRDMMGLYWTNFAKYHNPNGKGTDTAAFTWPAFDHAHEKNIMLNVPTEENGFLYKASCDMWDSFLGRS